MPPARVAAPLLARALAKGIAPAYYIHGDAAILKDEALAQILAATLDPTLREFNLDHFSAKQLEPDQLAAACSTLPMMAERRVVVVRDIEAWRRKSKAKQDAVAYLAKPAPETVVILVQSDDDDADPEIAAHCTSVDCAPPVGDALDLWVSERLQQSGVVLTGDALEHLLRATGGEPGLLAGEIAKLSGLQTSGPIDRATVGEMVGIRFGETIDDWRDAVFRDQVAEAVQLTPRLLELTGNSGVKLVTMLGSSLLVLRWARAAAKREKLRDQALTRAVQQFCFTLRPQVGAYQPFTRLIAEVVGKWPETRLRAALEATLTADIALKNTTISDETGILTDLLIALGTTRSVLSP